ncbi:hypothetical protein F0562_026168 [Nyssa sinensis]|uniref:Uncharacterized protein n=1 Tax=Nyssa sinensis TaxID=561372 RepID=A0A5J5BAR4_9ASTE|nr:hypothetical protein F0562_026168 [Nyssa sinensis]
MVMDRQVSGYYGSMNEIKFNDGTLSTLLDQDLNGFKFNDTFIDHPPLPPGPSPDKLFPTSTVNLEIDSHEDFDFSDVVLKYINEMLMEEDMEEKACMFQESAALQAAEKSFYEVLGEKYPPSPDHHPNSYTGQNIESPDECDARNYSNCNTSSSSSGGGAVGPGWNCDISDYESPHIQSVPVDLASRSTSHSSFSSSSSSGNVVDGPADSPVSTLRVPEIFSDSQSVMQFKRGVEEASKFLPNGNASFIDLGNNGFLVKEQKREAKSVVVKLEKNYASEYSPDWSRGKKNPHPKDLDLEERSNKQSAVSTETTVRSEMFDMVLLCNGGQGDSAFREALQNGASKNMQQNNQSQGSNGGKARGKKQASKKKVVDLRTLLTLCAQSVAANDRRTANELLEQIRQHSSPTGDGMQRMAYYFADGLEARMAGFGTQIHRALITWPTSAATILKAYHLYLACCPFKKLANFFSNKTIMHVAEKATRLHIVDFGILYGFQWPCLIQRLSSRPSGPPKLRITGIDLPHPGFRPAERVEETGHRLANYAETFNVPFEFNAIAQKWETIQLNDLKIDRDEVLVVNCHFRFRNLLDDTVVAESPRDIVLKLITKMNPDVYIQGIVNGTYNAPFFITRFREALFHYSSLFDMLETNVPREMHERMLIEKEIFGREVMNVIACEGAERMERPETYRQWQGRNLRAGFRQLPLNQDIMQMAKDRVKTCYHKDFVIDEDGHWMLQGWKGRIIYALSSWKPAN